MKKSDRVRVSGPLARFCAGFGGELFAQGYVDASVAAHIRLAAHLSQWMARRAVTPEQITDYVVEQFISDRRKTHVLYRSPRALEPLLRYLRSLGVGYPRRLPEAPGDELLAEYERYLVEERSVQAGRRQVCMAAACAFLEGRAVTQLSPADVTAFVQAHRDASDLVSRLSGLRSVLRFLFLHGHTPTNLVHAVPSASRRRLVSLPKGLEGDEVEAVLASCDRRTTLGRRNYAVLLLMVRLGLRAGEVAALTLDDIDWETGEIAVRGKGSAGTLPLPADVGQALVSYLRRRRSAPGCETRSLFLRSRAPYREGKAGMIVALAAKALRAAGLSGGGHRLRHTAASQMLRRGASLTEIAQVLRHRHIDTTAIYAKVDRDRLRTLARPWPSSHDRDELCMLAQPWPGGAA